MKSAKMTAQTATVNRSLSPVRFQNLINKLRQLAS